MASNFSTPPCSWTRNSTKILPAAKKPQIKKTEIYRVRTILMILTEPWLLCSAAFDTVLFYYMLRRKLTCGQAKRNTLLASLYANFFRIFSSF